MSLFLTVSAFTTATAQTFIPIRIDSRQYPDIQAKIYALDATGMPQSLGANAVTAAENGMPLTVSTTCEPSTSGRNLSLLVALDITASNTVGSPTGIDLMKNAARGVSQLLTSTSDEIGLVTIDAQANLLYGMSTDKTAYTSEVDNVRASGGINLTNGLMNQPMGALIHLQNARNNRALLLMTDGAPTFDLLTTLGTARTFGIRVYVICLKSRATDQLKRLADSSGGAWVENISTTADATAWARGYVADAKTFPACNASWTSITSCVLDRRVAFTVGTTTLPLSYQIPNNVLGVLEASTLGIDFGQPSGGNNVTRSLMLTARNADVIITAFSLSALEYSFITPPSLPLTIRKEQSVNLTIQYAPSSINGRIGLLTFTSATCNLPQITLRGGSPFRGDLIHLLEPNGGETFVAGTDTVIQWTNILPQEVVRLELSTNSGVDWKPLAEAANGLSYKWRPGPTVSDRARIRISRTVIDPNNIIVLSGQDQPVYSAIFTADGQNVITGGHDGTVRLWNAFNGNQIKIVGLHTNWVWSLDVMPNTKFVASGSFDGTVRVWDYSSGARIATIQVEGTAFSVAFTPNGQQLLVGTPRGITVISTSTWLPIFSKIVEEGPVYDIDIAQSGDVMAIAEGTKATLRDVNTLDIITTCSSGGRQGKIYAAALSSDKSKIAAGGTDFIIGLFDASSGAQLLTSQPVSGAILGLQFSSSNTILAASGDGTAKIYDASNMAMQSSLAGHQGLVYGARFSPDGKRAASASTDFTARIWTLDGIGTVQDDSDGDFKIIGAAASALTIDMGDVALGSGTDKIASAVSATGLAPLRILNATMVSGDLNDFGLLTTSFPPTITSTEPLRFDVSFVPTQLGPRTADIDVVTGTGIVRVRVTGNGVNPSLISPVVINYGRRVSNQAVVDTVINIRMPQGATQPVNVNTVSLNGPQANQFSIQSGGGAFTLTPGQSRSIVVRFEPIDFGRFASELVLELQSGAPIRVRLYGEGTGDGRIATTIALLYPTDPCVSVGGSQPVQVSNIGNTQMQIYYAGIEGRNANEFSATPPSSFPIKLDPAESIIFTVSFNPTSNGPKDAKVVFASSALNAVNGRSVVPISARRDSVGFELSRTVVDFSNVIEGQESLERLLILNTGTVALRWPRNPITIGRFSIENILPEVTQPGARSEFTVRFLGGSAGTTYDNTFNFVDSVCRTTEPLRMIATVKSNISATLRISTVSATTGQEVAVPVYISNKVNFDRTSVTQLDMQLLVNGTILTPTSGTPMGTFRPDGMRLIPITIQIPTTDSLATTLHFNTSWGNDTLSAIHIDSLVLADTLEIKRVDGGVIISDICREGGARLFQLAPAGAGIRVAPLPASGSTTAALTTIEAGRTTVQLVDLTGRVVSIIADRVMQGGAWYIPIDLTTIPNGSYYLVMTTPSQRIVERLEVVR